jgi:hypothetical protein
LICQWFPSFFTSSPITVQESFNFSGGTSSPSVFVMDSEEEFLDQFCAIQRVYIFRIRYLFVAETSIWITRDVSLKSWGASCHPAKSAWRTMLDIATKFLDVVLRHVRLPTFLLMNIPHPFEIWPFLWPLVAFAI